MKTAVKKTEGATVRELAEECKRVTKTLTQLWRVNHLVGKHALPNTGAQFAETLRLTCQELEEQRAQLYYKLEKASVYDLVTALVHVEGR